MSDQVMDWTTRGDSRVSMLAEPVATDQGVADRVLCHYDQQKGKWAVFLANSNAYGRIGPVTYFDFEHLRDFAAEHLVSQWPPADRAQIAELPRNRPKGSIPTRILRALGGLAVLIAVLAAMVGAGIVVLAVGFAVSPELTMGIFVVLIIVARVWGRGQ